MNCKTCDQVLSRDAAKCPGCGGYTTRGKVAIWIALALLTPLAIVFGVVFFVIMLAVLGG